jgi:hypothetical protein
MSLQGIIRNIAQPLFAILLLLSALAQQPARSIPSTGFAGLDRYRASRVSIYTDDFGELKRYRDADAGLAPPAAREKRVIFVGDSVTDYWKLQDFFLASRTSTAASMGKPHRRCWCVSAGM